MARFLLCKKAWEQVSQLECEVAKPDSPSGTLL